MQSSAIWLKRWVYEWWVISRVSYITYPPMSLTLHTARSIEVDYIVYFWHRSVAPLVTVWRLSYLKKKKTVSCSEGTRSCLGLLTLHVHTLLSLVICCRGILLFHIVLFMHLLIGMASLVFPPFTDSLLLCEFEYFIYSPVLLCYFLSLVMIPVALV